MLSDTPMLSLESIWAIEPSRFVAIVAALESHGLRDIPAPAAQAHLVTETHDDVAVIDIVGVMEKRLSLFSALFGGTSTQFAQQAVEQAAADPRIRSILLRIDSPGGSVSGLAELGDAVFAARKRKPVVAQIDGIGASAAYYVASQASEVFAQRMDVVGSIGTRMMLYDTSRLFANAGIVAVPIDSGEFKSAGAMGTEITERHREHFQSLVDSFFDDFVAVIVRGRGMSETAVRAVGDGRVMTAPAALQAGLIDGIQTFEQTLARLGAGRTKETAVEATATEPKAATLAELKKSIPDSDAEFRESCLEGGCTLVQAQAEWSDRLREQNKKLKADLDEAKAATVRPGVKALETRRDAGEADAGDPVERFSAAVGAKVAGGMDRYKAVEAVVRKEPALHREYLLATNSGKRAQRLIEEKYE